MARSGALVPLIAALFIGAVPGCRCSSSGLDSQVNATAAPSASASSASTSATSTADLRTTEETDSGSSDEPIGTAGHRFRDAEPKIEVDLEGPPDPACTGAEVALASAVVDSRCAIGSARAKKLRAVLDRESGTVALRQEAKVVDDGQVALRLVNTSGKSLMLALSFHAKLPAFTVLAEDDRHTLYELEPPQLELRDPGQGNLSHFARIVLPPGGVVVAAIAISRTIVRVLGRGAADPCKDAGAVASADGGPCSLTKLPKGRYLLHIGQLFTDVEAGAPAHVSWSLP